LRIVGMPKRLGQLEKGFRLVSELFVGLIDGLASDTDRILQPSECAIGDTQTDPHEGPAVGAGCVTDAVIEALFEQRRRLEGLAVAREALPSTPVHIASVVGTL